MPSRPRCAARAVSTLADLEVFLPVGSQPQSTGLRRRAGAGRGTAAGAASRAGRAPTADARRAAQVLSESLAWMGRAVEDFGLGALDVRLLLEWLKADLGSANAGVRNAATALAGVGHRQLGPGLAGLLREHVKPALMAALEESFAANPQRPARAPGAVARRARPPASPRARQSSSPERCRRPRRGRSPGSPCAAVPAPAASRAQVPLARA